ncbi:hypothetical protein N2152v2_007936 [Parachlorella kessleri]
MPSMLVTSKAVQAGAAAAVTGFGDGTAAAEELLFTVDQLMGDGDCESAVAALEAGAHRLTTRFGPDTPGLLPIYGQLALLKFVEGKYEGALHAAQRCYAAAVQREGEGSRGTLPHAVRYGVMLLASGDTAGALPLLHSSGCQLELHVRQLEAAAAALPSRAELGQLQGMMEELFDCAVALGEATFYHSLGRIARSNHSKEAILREEGGLLDGLETLKHSLEANHIILVAALREHSRLVSRALERGQKLSHIELALQHKRLHDNVRAAVMFDLPSDDED